MNKALKALVGSIAVAVFAYLFILMFILVGIL